MKVGDTLGPVEHPPITTRQLVEYAGASLDFNRVHYDEPFAKAGGHPSVIAHGMLSMAFIAQLAASVGEVRSVRARFKAVAYPGDVVTVAGTVEALESGLAELTLVARRGTVTLIEGSATVRV